MATVVDDARQEILTAAREGLHGLLGGLVLPRAGG